MVPFYMFDCYLNDCFGMVVVELHRFVPASREKTHLSLDFASGQC